MITELVGFSFIQSDQRDDVTAIMAALLRPGAKRRRCRASFNAPLTPGRTGGSHYAAAAAMDLHPLQQARGAYRKLVVGSLDRPFPECVFPLIRLPAHPFRLPWRRIPGAPPFTAKLAVQHCGSSLRATEAILSLTGVSEAIGLPAPEMPSAIRQIELRGLAIGSWTSKPPSPPAIGRHGPNQPNAISHETVALAIIAR
jgi:hypothetical protein